MKYFYIEPEVAGGLGSETVLDRSTHPPVVARLHYHLDGWLGDVLLESFPAFVVTEAARQALVAAGIHGAAYDEVKMTVSDQFAELYPDEELPRFVWLKPVGEAGRDDIGAAADGRLVASQRALEVLQGLGLANALVEPFEVDG